MNAVNGTVGHNVFVQAIAPQRGSSWDIRLIWHILLAGPLARRIIDGVIVTHGATRFAHSAVGYDELPLSGVEIL